MKDSSNFTPTERLESIKVGIIAGLSALVTFGFLGLLDLWISEVLAIDPILLTAQSKSGVILSGMISAVSGFLFGVTYRYIVRTDQNIHLKSGAVVAFGLIRGLAAYHPSPDAELYSAITIGIGVLGIAESLILFTVAAIAINFAFRWRWLKPFKSMGEMS
ncbi:MAG: hypothetical protein HC825_09645 [Oscillatoriales cyanobacterium RM1_1_9]|nr:hypothetical protein [Oscillatoriales cyanobacterium SM2_3_0]NJO44222.1 hypothetical protein [Oscillatoriales cyanobacterium RM2_1_1]NJO71857.1 hypothetical protein [Oscillatoriales cyanobacterium RM1_1_9]